jgi:sugar lactone lactonase YvrE
MLSISQSFRSTILAIASSRAFSHLGKRRCSTALCSVLVFTVLGALKVCSAQANAVTTTTPYIYTFAGNGTLGYSGDGGPATAADLNAPEGTALDSAGNLYIADGANNVVRMVAAGTGVITTVAGNGTAGYSGDNGAAISAELNFPISVALDSAGNLYISDFENNVIRMVAATTGVITTYAGNNAGGAAGPVGDNGPATSANLYYPMGIAIDSAGNLYIASQSNRIRKVAAGTGIITTVAGNGTSGYSGNGNPATSAELDYPDGLALDSAGNLYIADAYNNVIRKVNASNGVISTVAGNGTAGYKGDGGPATNAELSYPESMTVDSAGDLYIADGGNQVIRKVTAGSWVITTVVGSGGGYPCSPLGDGGPASSGGLCGPDAVSEDSAGNLYVSDAYSERIRLVTASGTPPIAATAAPTFSVAAGTYACPQVVSITDTTPGAAVYLTLNGVLPSTIAPGYNGPINVTGSVTIQAIAAAPGYLPSNPATSTYTITSPPTAVITTVAGNGTLGFSGIGGLATSAEIGYAEKVKTDGAGNLYIADEGNSVIWMVSAKTGVISIVAGTGTRGNTGDGGLATSAELDYPYGIVVDSAGDLYIADVGNNLIRKVTASTGIITTIAGNYGIYGAPPYGDGGPAMNAELMSPDGLALDSAGNLYIADNGHHVVREISASTGIITTVAGSGETIYLGDWATGDGGPATSAVLNNPTDVAVDSAGNLYIADSQQPRIRKVSAATGIITTVAGTGDMGSSGDGGLATSAEIDPIGIALDSAGNLYISDWATVREVAASTGMITKVAGNGYQGYFGDGGSATVAEIEEPQGIAFDPAGNLYIEDFSNFRVRKVTFPSPAPAPMISLAAGTYTGAQTVTITDGVQGATIYYTTDGTTPTTASNVYNGSITVSATETLQAIAVATGYTESAVATAAYTINLPVTPSITWATPAAISYGTALSATQLNAISTVAGAFLYSPVAGTVLNVGSHTLSVTFTPTDTTDYTTATASVTLTVNQATPTITLVSSANPAFVSNPEIFKATVSSPAGTPTGTVSFYDGTALLGQGTLTAGIATLTTSALAAGSLSISAVYSGDANFASVTSAVLTETIENFTLAPASGSGSATASPGGQATYALAIAPPSGTTFAAPITFSITGLPPGATAAFSPATVAAGSGATSVTLTVTLPNTSAAQQLQRPFAGGLLPVALGLILLPFAGRLRRASRRLKGTVWLVVMGLAGAALLAGLMAGCGGGGSSPGPTPQSYTLTITATSGSLSNTATVNLTVE